MDMSKYLGILRWSLNYSDGTKPTDVKAMDPETRKWLQEALEQNVVDPVDQMKSLVKVLELRRPEQGNDQLEHYVQNKVDALMALSEWVEQIDWAADLHKIGGFKTVIGLINEEEEESIRCGALEVAGTVVQNNPKCQEWAMELGLLERAMANFERGNLSKTEQAKTLFCVSSLIRDHTKATVAFIKEHKGVALLMKIIENKDKQYGIQVQRKALFLMRYILTTVPAIKIALGDQLLVSLNSAMLSQDVDLRENAITLICSMYEDPNVVSRISSELRAVTQENIKQFDKSSTHFKELDEPSIELAKRLQEKLNIVPLVAPADQDTKLLMQ